MTYVRRFGLCIPAITSIMGHLVVHMLAEAKLVFCHANFYQVKVDSANEVSQDGVIDDFLK